MKKLLFAALALTLSACGPQTVSVTMNALNDSGQDGKATLTQEGNNVRVVVNIKTGSDTGEQTGHIHEGNCPGLGAVKHALSNVVNGTSITVVENVTLESISKTAINIHNSQNPSRYVSCGEIP